MNFPRFVVGVAALMLFLGCGGGGGSPDVSKEVVDKQAQAKLQALKDIADSLPKGPNSPEVLGALETWRSLPYDAKTFPKETAEMEQIYKTKIQGKAKGEAAQELNSFFGPLLGAKK